MGRKVIYWVVTGLLALSAVFAGVNYLSSSQASNPRIRARGIPAATARSTEGLAKLLGGITLIVPGLTLKEWAYAGFTFAWIEAVIAHYLAKDGSVAVFPLILLSAAGA